MDKVSITVGKKINHLAWVLAINGVVLLVLAVFIVWIPLMVQVVIGLIVVVIAWVFLYSAYKLWHLKNILDKFIKF